LRGREHQAARVRDPFLVHQPLHAAQHIAEIVAATCCDILEPVARLVLIPLHRAAGLHDRDRIVVDMMRGAHRSAHVLGADALVHARDKILARQEVMKRVQRIAFATLGQFLGTPGLAHQALRAVAVAFAQQDPGERELALGGEGMIASEAVHCGRVHLLLPQPRFGAPMHQGDARPVGLVGNERCIAAEGRLRIRMAQDEPFGEFLRGGVGDLLLRRRRIVGFRLAGEIDRILQRAEIAGEARRLVLVGLVLLVPLIGNALLPALLLLQGSLFLRRGRALVARGLDLLHMRYWLVASGERIARRAGKNGEHKQTRQRPE
jgi:hypothetical protein